MKTLPSIILILAAISVVLSCKKDDIDVYKMEDSAVSFVSTTNSFSLRGLTEALDTLRVPLELVGPVADYDRPVSVLIKDHERNTAKENADFRIIEAVVKAGAMSGYILVEVKKLQVNVDELVTTLQIQPNEYFRKGYSGFDATIVSWSETYARPAQEKVWRAWYNFFCHGYSRNLHSVLITVFGEEIETYSQQKPTEEEAARVRADFLASAEQTWLNRGKVSSSALVSPLLASALYGEPAVSLEDSVSLYRRLVPEITAQELSEAVRLYFPGKGSLLLVTGPESARDQIPRFGRRNKRQLHPRYKNA